jgi:ABC-type Fe3+-hydroxamate transport system substrate-binding protein
MNKGAKIVSLVVLTAVLSFSFLVSCASKSNTSTSVNSPETTTDTSSYQIEILDNNQQVASVSLAQLHALPSVTLTLDGKSEVGPTLSSVLELAGIKDFSQITVSGMLKGRLATGQLTLKPSDITAEVILSYNNMGKTKLCGTQIPDSNWIIDVAEIETQ